MSTLSKAEVERFYRVWFPLLYYVNQKRALVDDFPEQWGPNSVDIEDAIKLRDAMWQDDSLRENFIAENPAKLSQADLALVERWQHRIDDTFFIFRHLKKHTIFITEQPLRGYGVHGLVSSLEDLTGGQTPMLVKTVLIPFEDRIIYDSFVAPYPVMFGSGYRNSLNEYYREIKERGGIITTLPIDDSLQVERVVDSNKQVLKAFQKFLGQSGLSPQKMEEHTQVITTFAEDYMQAEQKMLLDMTNDDIEAYRERVGKVNLVSFKRFTWFLRDTERIWWEDAEDLLDYIKQAQRKKR